MTPLINQHVDAHRCPEGGNLLSNDLDKRNIELQFLHRLLSLPANVESTFHFGRSAAPALEDSAEASFSRMTDSSMDAQLAKFEQEVPVRPDFGAFRWRRE
jgi:hypothetical protein